ncbi:hypothetical protein [Mammaliicoccus sciuri]|uniref:LSM domain-containing protein n=1 Tax=Mammaliicoccus sciuri TaxID=1296 RepID=A0AAW5LN64_MAMSC|nr:hypothetical protein [Mammaliicoccus sciuri]MBG9206923.1 hypothetical protein [Mammaliicoccus sciuri]MCQ9304939.1 hypothetical protein [Mammaliicoccus sciuri]MDT0669796.1 hypothetical protein [Mammaliicoccus sciuri]
MANQKQQPQKKKKTAQPPNAFYHFLKQTLKVKFMDGTIVTGKLISYTLYEIVLEVKSKNSEEVSRMIIMKQSIKWAREIINPESNTEEE